MGKVKWPLLAVFTIILGFAFIWSSPAVRFALALVLLRIGFFIAEHAWSRLGTHPAVPE